MNEKLLAALRQDIDGFEVKICEFTNGEIDRKAYKGFSGGFGSYAQKESGYSMLRLRLPGGRLTKERLGFIAGCAEKYNVPRMKLTTCQTIQMHDLTPQSVVEIMKRALDYDIVTRGGGGDFPRNVMVSPLSGVEQGEYFDVLPTAQAVNDYLLARVREIRLPRKLKIGFSNGPANETHATFRDLGFAARADGTFDVYCAGGLGANQKMGILVDTGVAPRDVLYDVCAMVKTFQEHGNYENRARARTRYLQETLGEDGLKTVFRENLALAKKKDMALALSYEAVPKTGGAPLSHPRAIPQKQPGLYAVAYHPIGGMLSAKKPAELYESMCDAPGAEWRVGPDETMYCINLTAEEAQAVLAVTEDGARDLFESSVACVGAATCQQGVRDSQSTLKMLVEAMRREGFADGVLPRIHISGCPSSCGTHQIGTLGFRGGVKLVDKKPMSAYMLYAGGCDAQGAERFGQEQGMMLEQDIPAFLGELGRAVRAADGTFAQWYPAHEAEFKEIAARYIAD